MTASDSVVVNSNFTKSIVNLTFGPQIAENARVIYPCVDTTESQSLRHKEKIWQDRKVFLSINRFEEKKGIELAIRAYHGLTPSERQSTRLVMAGGYDPRIPENVRYHKHLDELASSLGLSTATASTMPTALAIPSSISVVFLLSIPSPFKDTLLNSASLLLYTPQNEHFGIVPVEAMFAGIPVLAATTGGPLETVVEGQTGWLRPVDDVHAWTSILRKISTETTSSELEKISQNGRKRVSELFSRTVMASRFEEELQIMLDRKERNPFLEFKDISMFCGLVGVFVASMIAVLIRGSLSSSSSSSSKRVKSS
ncbi:putative alpha-mannosyltransferase [Phaeomoniella chlamydospora]|uniref:Alpha-1,3/1,6-mannosyltransferase ALG2 n=1 Tax=Phaeomoniella chlamydospora TaxID=158046 RepID=A0A0G2EY07_PHACM|nr:putative alpha-mannosyltransferase [Phaeomoniella chlamydospora]